MKKTILTAVLFLTLPAIDGLRADLFYTPGEYNRLYNEKIALELELKYLKKQYENDRGNLLSDKRELLARIDTLEGGISSLERRLKDDEAECAKNIAALEKSLAILKSTSGEKVKSLIEENRRIAGRCEEEVGKYRERLERESAEHLKKTEEIRTACDRKTAGLESLAADLRGEIADLRKLTDRQKEELARMGRQAEDLEKQLEDEIRKGDITVKRLRDRIVININNKILFESGSADLRKKVYGSLDKIKGILSEYPENRIMVEGHTDDVPIHTREFRDNWQLSTERALSVLGYLLKNTRLRPERFSAVGFGQFNPIVPNDTERNRALNRRVDITVVPSVDR